MKPLKYKRYKTDECSTDIEGDINEEGEEDNYETF